MNNQNAQQAIQARNTFLDKVQRRWYLIWRALRMDRNMLFGSVILVVVFSTAIFAPLIARTDPTRTNPIEQLQAPSLRHWFGTDHLGTDVFDRVVYGSRASLIVGFSVALITTVTGVSIGVVSGYYRRLDGLIMRIADAIMAFPTLLLALAIMATVGGSMTNVILVLAFVNTPGMVRLVRGQVLSLREQQFVEGARAIGAPAPRILFIHITPNLYAVVMVQATLFCAGAIITEASLSFLGAGIPPYVPTWGQIIAKGRSYLQTATWISFFPGMALTLTVLAINLVGDGLRDALDPRLKRRM